MKKLLCASIFLRIACAADACRPLSMADLAGDPLVTRTIHSPLARHPLHVASDGISSASQEWLDGKRKSWVIEFQRGGANLVVAGAVLNDHKMVDAGLRMFEWGFSRQSWSDGGFPDSVDAFHSTSIFAAEVARSLLMLKAKPAEFGDFTARVDAMIPRLNAAGHWLLRPGVLEPGKRKDQPYTHRKWILALALGGTGKLSGDRELADAAAAFANEGLALQQPDGRNPEKDGYDVSYQMVDALLGSYYYTTLDCGNSAELTARVQRMTEKTCQWEMRRILPNGEIDVTGSTRMLKERQHNGSLKRTNYPEVVQAFAYTARITGKVEYLEAAERIAKGQGWMAAPSDGAIPQAR